jgi:site-specific DNA-cytosine methylase
MSFSDEDFKKAESAVSNTQLYKAAGDSICEEVLKAIFSNLF